MQGAVFQEITVTGELDSAIDRMARRGEEGGGGGREKRGRGGGGGGGMTCQVLDGRKVSELGLTRTRPYWKHLV